MSRAERIEVGILGATGSVGQRFITLLADHPWFEIAALAASERSAGKPYGEAVRWMQSAPLPERVSNMVVHASAPPSEPRLLFSALDGSIAGPVEAELARQGHLIVSNARSHRMDEDVPLLVPEVNAEHLDLIEGQSFGDGAIITNPNCSTIGLVLALKPLYDSFGLDRVNVVTMQAVSGAGIPGVSSLAHRRQRGAVHLGRRREDADGDAEGPGALGGSSGAPGLGHGECPVQSRASVGRPHGVRFGVPGEGGDSGRGALGVVFLSL